MTVEEYLTRRELAALVLGAPIVGWWMHHTPCCPANVDGICECMTDVWFSSFTRTVCVTPDLRALIHPIH